MYLFFFKFFSQLCCYRILSRILCLALSPYWFCILNIHCVHVGPKLLTIPSPYLFPPSNHKFVLKVCDSVSVL